jgi:hypothetical protein
MNTAKMMERIAQTSPRIKARMAGLSQLLEALTATFGQVIVPGKLFVLGSAATTATNILAHQQLFWLGFGSSLIGVIFHIVWAFLLYDLLKPVDRRLSLFAMFVILVACAVQALNSLLYVAPLSILTSGNTAGAFTTEQLQALALLFVKLNTYAFDIYLVFFGFWLILIGYLIFRSAFMPRVLGVLLAISGLGWMLFLIPPFATHLFPVIAAASALGEIPLEFWLIIKSVNAQRWREQASLSV